MLLDYDWEGTNREFPLNRLEVYEMDLFNGIVYFGRLRKNYGLWTVEKMWLFINSLEARYGRISANIIINFDPAYSGADWFIFDLKGIILVWVSC